MISVIIPVKNGEATLAKCLSAIKNQTITHQIEIIILDSCSTDRSVEIAVNFGARIINIPNVSFNHGLTRNEGVKYANGELLFFTVQDASLAESDQLERMASHFKDINVNSVSGIQAIPSDLDKNPAIWFRRFSQPIPEIKQFEIEEFNRLSPEDQLKNCRWDNVNAMYRKLALQAVPFQETDFAEDALWGRDALLLGFKIIRDPSLVVYHYHHHSFNYSFQVSYILNYTFLKRFKVSPEIPSLITTLGRNIYTLAKRKELSMSSKIGWAVHNALSLSANFLSVIIFKSIYLYGGETLLDKSYHLFCSKVPQGSHKGKMV